MNRPTIQPIGRFLRAAKTLLVLLVLSFVAALYLANSGAFWHFVSWLPRSFTEGLIGFLHSALSLGLAACGVQPLNSNVMAQT